MTICGKCTMCCKLLGVAELDKPVGQWCPHCKVGSGCNIYAERPSSCHTYECIYYTWVEAGHSVPLTCRPDNCHVVIDCAKDGRTHHVRPEAMYPDAWRKPPVIGVIQALLAQGMPVYLVQGDTKKRLETAV